MASSKSLKVRGPLLAATSFAVLLAAGPGYAQVQARNFRVAAQPAATGMTEFARQAGVQILVSERATQGRSTGAVMGSLSVEQGLKQLLNGAGLQVMSNDGRTIVLGPKPAELIRTQYAAPTQNSAAPQSPAAAATPEPPAPEAETAVDSIQVTGTRLVAAGFTAPTPVTVIGSAQIEQKASASIFEVIRDIPSFRATSGPSANSTGAQSASKANLDLRGLGATRTLVLINGRRHVADGTGNVFDTNLIPTSLVERVDIVTGGASAAYGSDAVAGVVNFVMKNRFEGFNLDLRYGQSERGDNIEYNPSFAYGTSFMDGRAHFVIGGDVTTNHGTGTMFSRPWGRLEPGLLSISAAAIPNRVARGLAANIISNNVETSAYTAGGLITSGPLRGIAFGDNGQTYVLPIGPINGGTEMIGGGNYGSVENPDQFLRAAYNRAGALARLEYDFTEDTIGFAQLHYGALGTHGRSFGARVPNFSNYPVLITNPFLPDNIRAAMVNNNITTFNYSASRRDDLGSIESHNQTETLQFDIGLSGKVFGDWSWDVGADAGESTFWPYIANTPRTADFYQSAYVVAGPNGVPVCGDPATNPYFLAQPAIVRAQLLANLSPGCTPYNIFGTNKEQNQGALKYFNSASASDFEFRQYVVSANLAGSPFSLPAGEVSTAVGVEARKEKLSSVNCPDCQKGALMNQNYSLFKGEIDVREIYGEVGVPLLSDVPFVQSLDVNGAVRFTDYSTSGQVTTWKVGATWDISDMVRMRATRSHDIRAPNINELFNPGSEGNPNIINRTNGVSGFTKSNTIGNPNLQPEVGDTFTVGIVFQPEWKWASGFRASIDYYDIKIEDVIATLGVQTILDEVLVNQNADFEQFVVRDATPLGISRVNVPQLNLNALETHGVDVELQYRVPLDAISLPGNLNLRALGTWIGEQRTITTTTDIDSAGVSGSPKWSWTGTGTYRINRLTAGLQVRYTSPIKFSATLIGPDDPAFNLALSNSINRNLWPSATYFNAFGSYELVDDGKKRIQVYGAVDNILDKDPPIVAISLGGSAYDLVGRAYKLGLRVMY